MNPSRPALYLETTIPSYLVARPSNDIITLGHRQITREWWNSRIQDYEVFVSEVVFDEISRGDAEAAKRRLELIGRFSTLRVTDGAAQLAHKYLSQLPLPRSALADALHLALASIHGMEYLVTWNCRHIAKGSVIRLLPSINAEYGLSAPAICTPEELLYEDETVD